MITAVATPAWTGLALAFLVATLVVTLPHAFNAKVVSTNSADFVIGRDTLFIVL